MKIPALCACLALTALPRGDAALQFSPLNGEELHVDFKRVLKLALEKETLTIEVDGKSQPMPESPPQEFTLIDTETVSYADIITMEHGQLVGIERNFKKIGKLVEQSSVDPAGETFTHKTRGSSALEGTSVQFLWNEEDGDFKTSFIKRFEDRDESLLEPLKARADFTGFLPKEDLDEGDSWELPSEVFRRLTNLCGDLSVVQEGVEENPDKKLYETQFANNLAGRLTVTWKETIRVGVEQHAVLAIHAKLRTSTAIEDAVTIEGQTGTQRDTDAFEFELRGALHWNLARHYAHSLNLSGAVELRREKQQRLEWDGKPVHISRVSHFNGLLTYTAAVE